jgi:cytochrome c6
VNSTAALGGVIFGLMLLTTSGTSNAADTNKGQQLFAANCAICHGQSGRSVMPGAPNFDRGEGLMRPDFTLLASIRAGKNAMPAYQGLLADRDILDVIAFLRTLH